MCTCSINKKGFQHKQDETYDLVSTCTTLLALLSAEAFRDLGNSFADMCAFRASETGLEASVYVNSDDLQQCQKQTENLPELHE